MVGDFDKLNHPKRTYEGGDPRIECWVTNKKKEANRPLLAFDL